MDRRPADRNARQLERAHGLLKEGRLTRARDAVDQVLARTAADVRALRLSGDIARAEGKLDKAMDRYVEAARLEPSHLATLDAIVGVGVAADRLDRATQALELAVLADPSSGARQRRLGQAYFSWSRYDDAVSHLRLATMLAPEDAVAWQILGAVLVHLEEHEQVLVACDRALAIDPDDGVSQVNGAVSLDELGRPDEARQRREAALASAPTDPTVAFQTKDLHRAAAGDPRFAGLQEVADDPSSSVDERVKAELTLVKLWDDVGDTARAAILLRSANERWDAQLRRRGQGYDPEATQARLRTTQHVVTTRTLRRYGGRRDGPVPVLLCGLPRAGKSLLEARLRAVSEAAGIGERSLGAAALKVIEERGGGPFGEAVERLDSQQMDEIRRQVLERMLPDAARDAPAVISTHPGNAASAGPTLLLDPRTVIVSCERDPRDLLIAVYQQFFPNGNPFAWSPDGLTHYLAHVQAFADHWAEVHPERFVRVRYEDLVSAPAGPVAEVLAAAQLPVPDDLPTRFSLDDTIEVAMSPSAKPDPSAPLHRAHVGMWRRWEPHLPELFSAIESSGVLAHQQP